MEWVKLGVLFIGLVNACAYVLRVWIKYGIQESISFSYYVIEKENRFVFQIFIWVLSFTIMFCGGHWLFILSGALLSIVGFTPTIKDQKLHPYHTFGAISGIATSFLGLLIVYNAYYICIIPVVLSLIALILDKKHILWWVEIVCTLTIWTAMLLNLL